MSLAFDLPLDTNRVAVEEVKRLRPFPEIPARQMHKRTPYEEFWVTDFEIEDYNRTIRSPGMGETSLMPTPQKI